MHTYRAKTQLCADDIETLVAYPVQHAVCCMTLVDSSDIYFNIVKIVCMFTFIHWLHPYMITHC